jgi:hypothetical protein
MGQASGDEMACLIEHAKVQWGLGSWIIAPRRVVGSGGL